MDRQALLSTGFSQARILQWVAISFSRGSSRARDWTWVSCIVGRFFIVWATREAYDAAKFWVRIYLQNLFSSAVASEPFFFPGCQERFFSSVFLEFDGICQNLRETGESVLALPQLDCVSSLPLAFWGLEFHFLCYGILGSNCSPPGLHFIWDSCQSPLWHHQGEGINSPAFDLSFLLCFCPDKSQNCFSWGHRGPLALLSSPVCHLLGLWSSYP